MREEDSKVSLSLSLHQARIWMFEASSLRKQPDIHNLQQNFTEQVKTSRVAKMKVQIRNRDRLYKCESPIDDQEHPVKLPGKLLEQQSPTGYHSLVPNFRDNLSQIYLSNRNLNDNSVKPTVLRRSFRVTSLLLQTC